MLRALSPNFRRKYCLYVIIFYCWHVIIFDCGDNEIWFWVCDHTWLWACDHISLWTYDHIVSFWYSSRSPLIFMWTFILIVIKYITRKQDFNEGFLSLLVWAHGHFCVSGHMHVSIFCCRYTTTVYGRIHMALFDCMALEHRSFHFMLFIFKTSCIWLEQSEM